MTHRTRRLLPAAAGVVALLVLAACGSDNTATSASTAASATTAAGTATIGTSGSGATTTTTPGVSASGITPERCAANKAAGTITYLSSFDFAAAASILDVVVAKDRGYFDDMCLNVSIKPGFSTSNYALVAGGQGQMSSAGSYTEILNYSKGGAKFEAVADYGKTPIEALVVRADSPITTLQDLKG